VIIRAREGRWRQEEALWHTVNGSSEGRCGAKERSMWRVAVIEDTERRSGNLMSGCLASGPEQYNFSKRRSGLKKNREIFGDVGGSEKWKCIAIPNLKIDMSSRRCATVLPN
jgi:hypothetical protein